MTLFTVRNRKYGWDEIAAAAKVWGEWQALVQRVHESLACLQFAIKVNDLPSEASVREVATAFRYAHNLISAEETNLWLIRWGMTVDEWMSCMRGDLLRSRWEGRLPEIVAQFSISTEEISQAVKRYAVCTGKIFDWSKKLAGRVAVASTIGDANLSHDALEVLIRRIESEFEKKSETAISAKLIESKINEHYLDWIHFECNSLWLNEERRAREAAWCISEDGLTLEEVAVAANERIQRCTFYADEIETSIRPFFLAARQGESVGPWRLQNSYPLFVVIRKRMPLSNDSQIVLRAEREIVNGLVARAINEHVKWVN